MFRLTEFSRVMDHSSDEETDFSDSEFAEHTDKPLEQLREGTLKAKHSNGILRCPFCTGKKKQSYKYKDLLQHASGVGKGNSNRSAKQKANHLALAIYLANDLAHESEQPPKVVEPKHVAPISEEKDSLHQALYEETRKMGEIDIKASESRPLWQNKVKTPEWHVVEVDGDDEKVKDLKVEGGNGVFDEVVSAFKEMNEYNPSGKYVVNKLWNLKDNQKAAMLKEKKIFVLKMVIFGVILMIVGVMMLTKFPLLTFPYV